VSRLNAVEFAVMNNPVRRLVQRRVELPAFERTLASHGVDLRGARILDAGCGSGYSTALLAARYAPSRLVAFDLMPEQVDRARARGITGAEMAVGDVTSIAYPDGSFDAAFVFGILHHVPEWRAALRELRRVLAPGGVLCVEELHGRYIAFQDRFLFTSHPREAAFDWPTFRAGVTDAGFAILGEQRLAFEAARSFVARVS
jgi:ubiquinone/menaquinone biosynthesis C-methylase UbiE